MQDRELKAGVVGLGMGRGHILNYRTSSAKVVAICDLDEARLKRVGDEFDIPGRYRDFDEMLDAEQLDLVSIALPNDLHAPFCLKALKAGLHVMCEKPLAISTEQARAITDAVEETGLKFMVHFNGRFAPAARALKQHVDSGALGDIYYVRTVWNRASGIPGGQRGWFTNRDQSGGGPLIDLGVHRLDLALWFLGYPRATTVTGLVHSRLAEAVAEQQSRYIDTEDFAAAFIRLETGAIISLESSGCLRK